MARGGRGQTRSGREEGKGGLGVGCGFEGVGGMDERGGVDDFRRGGVVGGMESGRKIGK